MIESYERIIVGRGRSHGANDPAEDLFRAAVEAMPDAVSMFEPVRDALGWITDFRWTFANDAAARMVGRSDLVGATLLDILPNHGPSGLLDVYRLVMETGEAFAERTVWYEDIWADGRCRRRAFDMRALSARGTLVLVTRDVTDQRVNSEQATLQGVVFARAAGHGVTLNELAKVLQGCASVEEIYASVAEACERVFRCGGSLAMLGVRDRRLEVVTAWGDVGDASLTVALVAKGTLVGELHLVGATDLDEALVDAAHHVGDLTATAVHNLRVRDQLETLSVRDPLTGVFNRRYMEETLVRELARAKRHKQPLGVIQLDVDDFKRFNDVHGHAAGDAVLKAVAAALVGALRTSDVVCRFGGEEFTVVMPDAAVDVAEARAESLRRHIEGLCVQHGEVPLPPVKISCGVAAAPEHGATPEALLRAADEALYAAKRAGRNRIARAPS